MPGPSDMELPFFDAAHRELAVDLNHWLAERGPQDQHAGSSDVDAICRGWVAALGKAGWLRYAVPAA